MGVHEVTEKLKKNTKFVFEKNQRVVYRLKFCPPIVKATPGRIQGNFLENRQIFAKFMPPE